MVYTIDDLQRIIAPIAEQYGLRAVYVFGSYARREANADSDIDLLVDLTGTKYPVAVCAWKCILRLGICIGKKYRSYSCKRIGADQQEYV